MGIRAGGVRFNWAALGERGCSGDARVGGGSRSVGAAVGSVEGNGTRSSAWEILFTRDEDFVPREGRGSTLGMSDATAAAVMLSLSFFSADVALGGIPFSTFALRCTTMLARATPVVA